MIRKAKLEDLEAIRLIARITWMQAYKDKVPEENIAKHLDVFYSKEQLKEAIENETIYLATEADLILAYAYFEVVGERLFIHALYVLPSSQREGIGTLLYQEILKAHPDLEVIRTRLEANTESAVSFFEKEGFEAGEASYFEMGGYPLKMKVFEKKL